MSGTQQDRRQAVAEERVEDFRCGHRWRGVCGILCALQAARRVSPTGVRTMDGEHEFDALVFATGFDAMTGPYNKIDIRGRDEQLLRDKWAEGPRTYLGLMSAGYPNLFAITGPQSPSVLTNMPVAIEQHVDWISGVIEHMQDNNLEVIERIDEAEDEWVDHSQEVAHAATRVGHVVYGREHTGQAAGVPPLPQRTGTVPRKVRRGRG